VTSTPPQQDAPAQDSRYEELRRHAVERQFLASRLGLAVLLQQGLAAWLEQWTKMPAKTQAPAAHSTRPSSLPDDCSTQVINVLTAMALGHVQEVHV
jgi:hypothetical protein